MSDTKKFYWIKLKTDFFNQDAIDFMLSQENGCEYIVLYQMLCLQTANNDGELSAKVGEMIVPYDVKKIVRDTRYFDTDTVMVALELFKKLGLVYEQDNMTLRIANFNEMIGGETKWAEKKRIYREKQRQLEDKAGDTERTLSDKRKSKEIEIEKEIDKEKDIEKDIERKKKTSVYFPMDEKLNEAFRDFVEMRKKIKKPMTDRAISLAIKKLEDLSKDTFGNMDNDKAIEIINQTVLNGWQSFYPLKEEKSMKRAGGIDWDNV